MVSVPCAQIRTFILKVALIVESGEVKLVHDFCVLLGFGADAVCPYMIYETCHRLRTMGLFDSDINDDQVHFHLPDFF